MTGGCFPTGEDNRDPAFQRILRLLYGGFTFILRQFDTEVL
ncbi:Hypothetical protein DEACI_1306 [Acididesulfobacillus acetoxydans]|uniref:Uncharacterized protein n=1 Tax=Acididesulfobacillus acetoxydans TaxID=1561005 RepID=A0A8S0VWA8_9FIRM|nr:Hypothetical protein DEACI_1306 [Acididesulfobacillus acetoxydans]CEJ09434.1 Hypothetical protein DEACI_3918 [Acididesulfobacillus acetoxydans]